MAGRMIPLRVQVNERARRLLVEARASAGLSQQELAARLGRPQSFVSKYEHGERRLDVGEFVEIAAALGLDSAQLIASELECRPGEQDR